MSKLQDCRKALLEGIALPADEVGRIDREEHRLGRIDAILTVRKYNDLEEDLVHAESMALSIQKIPSQTVQRYSCSC